MNRQKILLATDLPFWRGKTGAQQRIRSLVRFFKQQSAEVKVFCIAAPNGLTPEDDASIAEQQLDVEFRSSDQVPQGVWRKLGWYASATYHQYLRPRVSTLQTPDQPTTLDSFRWPWAVHAFEEVCDSFSPQWVVIEYVTLAYLLNGIPKRQRQQLTTMIDTHDLLHRRCEQFEQQGHRHWLSISADEERQALQPFDVVLAIQPEEACWFQNAAPRANVVLCPHVVSPTNSIDPPRLRTGPGMTLGYLGSDNASNRVALQRFLDESWPEIWQRSNGEAQLLIAGAVTNDRSRQTLPPGVHSLGIVEDLRDFYERVDVIVNPVTFGTGLKIKNIEALSFGKPLVTTPAGATGIPSKPTNLAVQIAADPGSFWEPIGQLLDPNTRQRAARAAWELSQTEFSEQSVWTELAKVFARPQN